jgi:hypothetical protein
VVIANDHAGLRAIGIDDKEIPSITQITFISQSTLLTVDGLGPARE